MKYKEKLNKRLYKNMENSTYIYYATNAFNEALHNAFKVCRLKLVSNKNRKSKLEVLNKMY